ncbi:MAG TPA: hypothetical protein VL728_05550 [Cyclobacteriaceae bacterium]|jgi:hypothetical protein|nr:hypothetical protein [Cyclobacteriaceae bacterium]
MKHWTVLIFPLVWSGLCAQDFPRKDLNPGAMVDEIFATQDIDVSYQDLYENYLQLLSNPLDLNSVTDEQLRSLYMLKQEQIDALLNYRKEAGPFISMYELQSIFDSDTFYKIAPLVIVRDETQSFNKSIFKRIANEPNNYLLLRWGRTMESQKGYSEQTPPSSQYAGSRDNFYARFRTSRAGDFSLGFTIKKDAGEKVSWNPSGKYYGFDYSSFHFQTQNKGKVKNLIIGDYQAQFGQGIALGSFFGVGKNGEAVNTLRKANLGFLPYTSLYEAGYFRGGAVSFSYGKNLTLHAMASARGRDGSLQQDTLSSTDYLSSFNYTGLHRTTSELANRSAVQETNFATVLQFKSHSLDVGLILHRTDFNTILQRNATIYNQFQFNGKENTNTGVFLNYNFSNIAFFSEFTQSIDHGNAVVAGLLGSFTSKLDVSFVYRGFERNFYSFYSNAIAENSTPQNETGIYWGWKYSFNKKYSLAGYFDLFSFPWLKYRSYSPSDGNESLLRFNYRPTKLVYIFVQARQESKQRNTGADGNLYATANGIKQSYSINCDYSANARLSFRSRAQFSSFSINGKTTFGSVLLQDATCEMGKLSVSARYALFDTDDFDNRIYVYERDAWLAFTFPSYYGKGTRQYLLLQYRMNKHVDFWLRWSQTHYLNTTSIGAGGETIAGDTRNDIKFQARLRFN